MGTMSLYNTIEIKRSDDVLFERFRKDGHEVSVGDKAVIVEMIYDLDNISYEIECSFPGSASCKWLISISHDDLIKII